MYDGPTAADTNQNYRLADATQLKVKLHRVRDRRRRPAAGGDQPASMPAFPEAEAELASPTAEPEAPTAEPEAEAGATSTAAEPDGEPEAGPEAESTSAAVEPEAGPPELSAEPEAEAAATEPKAEASRTGSEPAAEPEPESSTAKAVADDESEDGAANAKLSKLRPIGAAIGKKILSENYERPSITAAEPSEDEDSRSVSLKGQRGVANAKLSKLSKLSPLPSTTRMRLLSQNYGDPSVERSLSDTGSEGSDSDPVSPSKFDLG